MSENVELVRTMFAAGHRGGIDAARRGEGDWHLVYTDDVVLELGDWMAPGLDREYRGLDGARRFWMDWLAPWEDLAFDSELFERGDQVVAVIDQHQRGEQSGVELSVRWAQRFWFRDGKIARWRIYMNPSKALAEAGIEPGATAAGSFRGAA